MQAVVLAGPDGALELRAFAAPRNGDLWSEVRPQIAADIARRGGTATEREGRFGTELVCQVPVQAPRRHAPATQPSRIIGINGAALDAARHAARPPGRSTPDERRGLGGHARRRSSSAAATQRDAGRRAAAGRAARRRRRRVTTADARLTPCARARAGCGAAISSWANSADQHARDLRKTLRRPCRRGPIADAPDRERVRLRGTLRTVTLRPRGGVPALEAELYDGSGVITVVWLGRRRIAGIGPGRAIQVEGRIGVPRRPPDHVQPALRADPVSDAEPPPTAARRGRRRDRRGGRPRAALQGPRRPARHGRGRRPDDPLHRRSG